MSYDERMPEHLIPANAKRVDSDSGYAPGRQEITYAVSDGDGHIKIGKADDVSRRLKSLQTANPRELFLLGATRLIEERQAHGELKAAHILHVRGEWFKDGPRARIVLSCHHLIWRFKVREYRSVRQADLDHAVDLLGMLLERGPMSIVKIRSFSRARSLPDEAVNAAGEALGLECSNDVWRRSESP